MERSKASARRLRRKRAAIERLAQDGATEGERAAAVAALERFDAAHPTLGATEAAEPILGRLEGWEVVEAWGDQLYACRAPDGSEAFLGRRTLNDGTIYLHPCTCCHHRLKVGSDYWKPVLCGDTKARLHAFCAGCVARATGAPEPTELPGDPFGLDDDEDTEDTA